MTRVMTPKHHQGFSLVELMVSMVIALLVLAGVINSFLASRAAFEFNRELAFIQDNARYATEMLTREIRQAGYYGCNRSNGNVVNTLRTNLDSLLDGSGVEGFDTGSTWPAFISSDIKASTDAIIIRHADQDNAFVIGSHNPNAATIGLLENYSAADNTVFVIADADCSHMGIFSKTGPMGGGNTLNHAKDNASSPGNCTKTIKGTNAADADGVYDCNDCTGGGACTWEPPLAADATYGPDSTLYKLSARAFYVSNSTVDSTMPTLVMQVLGDGASVTREEVAPGVEDLQILYGLVPANDPGNTATPIQYFTANNVTDWELVATVRVSMVVRSENAVLKQAVNRSLLGKSYTDRYLRQLVTTTVSVRNKL